MAWGSVTHCRGLIRHVPKHWLSSIAEAKHAVIAAIRSQRSSSLPVRTSNLQRLWKLFSNIDALLLHRPQRRRSGKRGQGAHSLNAMLAERFRSFWAGAWSELWINLETSGGAAPVNS